MSDIVPSVTLETKTCGRCGGSGQYSYCQSYGTTCFNCRGRKIVYTKRGEAAAIYLKTLRSKRAADFAVGELFYLEPGPFNKGGFRDVRKIEIAENGTIALTLRDMGYSGLAPDSLHRRGCTAEEKAATLQQAIAYQATLTKLGKPRKGKSNPQ